MAGPATMWFPAGRGSTGCTGTGGDDRLYGGPGDDTPSNGVVGEKLEEGNAVGGGIFGGTGKDVLYGNAGADWLDGGANDDVLYGGSEGDQLLGGAGEDVLWGEDGGRPARGWR